MQFYTAVIGLFALAALKTTSIEANPLSPAAAVASGDTITPLVVNGRETLYGKRPYVSGLRETIDGTNFCGGSLITPKHILTAAHCKAPGIIYVSVGSNLLYSRIDGVQVAVRRSTTHPRYNTNTYSHDFLILELATEVNQFAPVPLVSTAPAVGTMATVAGWGVTESGNQSVTLLEADVPILSTEVCRRNQVIDSSMVCAGGNDKDSCQGDSGGPLVIQVNDKDAQVGVVSWGMGCNNPRYPGVYGRVSVVKAWIDKIVGLTSGNYSATWVQ